MRRQQTACLVSAVQQKTVGVGWGPSYKGLIATSKSLALLSTETGFLFVFGAIGI